MTVGTFKLEDAALFNSLIKLYLQGMTTAGYQIEIELKRMICIRWKTMLDPKIYSTEVQIFSQLVYAIITCVCHYNLCMPLYLVYAIMAHFISSFFFFSVWYFLNLFFRFAQ